jgi:hypothetical protein
MAQRLFEDGGHDWGARAGSTSQAT